MVSIDTSIFLFWGGNKWHWSTPLSASPLSRLTPDKDHGNGRYIIQFHLYFQPQTIPLRTSQQVKKTLRLTSHHRWNIVLEQSEQCIGIIVKFRASVEQVSRMLNYLYWSSHCKHFRGTLIITVNRLFLLLVCWFSITWNKSL